MGKNWDFILQRAGIEGWSFVIGILFALSFCAWNVVGIAALATYLGYKVPCEDKVAWKEPAKGYFETCHHDATLHIGDPDDKGNVEVRCVCPRDPEPLELAWPLEMEE